MTFKRVAGKISRAYREECHEETRRSAAAGWWPPLVAVPGCRSGTIDRAQCRMPGAIGHACRRRRPRRAGAAVAGGIAVALGRAAGARGAPACRPRHSACSMPASRRRRAGWSCGLGECTNCRSAANRRFSRQESHARSRVACWCTAGTSRAAGRVPPAWCSDPPLRPSNRWRPVRWWRSKLPLNAMPTRCGHAGRTSLVSGERYWSRRRTAPTVACTNYSSADFSALPRKHSRRMILEKFRTRCS